jgi:hypothetical protein
MPEWYFVVGLLGVLASLGLVWPPLLWAIPLLLVAIAAPVIQALLSASKAEFPTPGWTPVQRRGLLIITAVLHLVQPLARLIGRLRFGLSLWRKRTGGKSGQGTAGPARATMWSETWRPAEDWLGMIQAWLAAEKIPSMPGGDYDNWDLQVNGGLLGGARLVMAMEEHGAGKQMLKFRIRKLFPVPASLLVAVFALLTLASVLAQAWIATGVLGFIAIMVGARILHESAASAAVFSDAIRYLENEAGND